MGIIGNPLDALSIRDYWQEFQEIRRENSSLDWDGKSGPKNREPEIPDGWRLLGKGCYRAAFLSPDGTVYKVQHVYGGWGQSNREESANIVVILQSGKSHPNAYIPRTTFFELDGNGVIAMEMVTGEKPGYCHGCDYGHCTNQYFGKCVRRIFAEIESTFGLCDIHSDNVIFVPEQNRFAVIDIGA